MYRYINAGIGVFLLSLAGFSPAHAVGLSFTGLSVSISVSYNTATGAWIIGFDPDGVQGINLGLSYDTSMFAYEPTLTGFLCDFSDGGDCPTGTGQSGISTVPQLSINPGPERAGTNAMLTVNQILGTVDLNYDLTANPAPTGFNRQFFQLALIPLVPLSLSTVDVQTTPGSYDLTVTNVVCTSLEAGVSGSCGTDTPAYGVNFVSAVPVPAAVWLFGSGMIGLVGVARHRRA